MPPPPVNASRKNESEPRRRGELLPPPGREARGRGRPGRDSGKPGKREMPSAGHPSFLPAAASVFPARRRRAGARRPRPVAFRRRPGSVWCNLGLKSAAKFGIIAGERAPPRLESTMQLPSIDSASAALVAGLVTSLHCLGMCGPLACAVVPLRGDRADAQVASSIYHLTRLSSYAAFGALFGALGRLPMDWLGSGVARYLPWLLVVFFVAVAFRWDRYLPRVPWLGSVYLRVHGWGRARPPAVAAAALGLATPLLPCGPLYFVMALAMVTGSAWRGVEFMLAFGLGTVP